MALTFELLLQIAICFVVWRLIWPKAHWFNLLFFAELWTLFLGFFDWL